MLLWGETCFHQGAPGRPGYESVEIDRTLKEIQLIVSLG